MARHDKVIWTSELENSVLDMMCSGDSHLTAAKKLNLSPQSIYRRRDESKEFAVKYARAVNDRAVIFFERGNDIANGISSPEEAQVARVQLDWIKWASSKLAPKSFGDKVQQEISGPDGGAIQAEVTIEFVKPKTA